MPSASVSGPTERMRRAHGSFEVRLPREKKAGVTRWEKRLAGLVARVTKLRKLRHAERLRFFRRKVPKAAVTDARARHRGLEAVMRISKITMFPFHRAMKAQRGVCRKMVSRGRDGPALSEQVTRNGRSLVDLGSCLRATAVTRAPSAGPLPPR